MATYKCSYCGEIGNSSCHPKITDLKSSHLHAWRPLSENRIIFWKCRKCGMITRDDQTPRGCEGGDCPVTYGGSKSHTWDRIR